MDLFLSFGGVNSSHIIMLSTLIDHGENAGSNDGEESSRHDGEAAHGAFDLTEFHRLAGADGVGSSAQRQSFGNLIFNAEKF